MNQNNQDQIAGAREHLHQDNCVFCQIIIEDDKKKYIYEDDKCMVLKDKKPNPNYHCHYLIIPKIHINSIIDFGTNNNIQESIEYNYITHIISKLSTIAKACSLWDFAIKTAVGFEGGQHIKHLHIHMYLPKKN